MADANRTQGTDRIFDRETLLDLTVNFIPLGIILFFVVFFLVYRPFGLELVPSVIMMALLILPFAGLAVLTYFAGRVITQAERQGRSETAETVAESTMGFGIPESEKDDAEDERGTPSITGGDAAADSDGGGNQPQSGSKGTGAPAGSGSDRSERTHSETSGDDSGVDR